MGLDKKLRNYIEKFNRAGENLLGIINDILDFSKIEAGKLSIERIDFHLEDVMADLANLVGMKTEDKGLDKIETKTFVLAPKPVPVADILSRMAEVDRITYASKQLTISVDTDTPVGSDVPHAVWGMPCCVIQYSRTC